MGAQNVAAAYVGFKHLTHAQMRLLAFMALVSLDKPSGGQLPRRYFGGHTALAAALGLELPPAPSAELVKSWAANKGRPLKSDTSPAAVAARTHWSTLETLRRCLRALEVAGAIRTVRPGSGGAATEYEITVNLAQRQVGAGPSALPQPDVGGEPGDLPQREVGAQPQPDVGGHPQPDVGFTPNLTLGTGTMRNQGGVQEEPELTHLHHVTARDDDAGDETTDPDECPHGVAADKAARACPFCRRAGRNAA